MYAIFEHGSHQYRVREGDQLHLDKIAGDPGTEVTFDRVLLIAGTDAAPAIGAPVVAGAKVVAQIARQFRDKKIVIQKFRRRKGYRRRKGHRQHKTTLRILSVVAGA